MQQQDSTLKDVKKYLRENFEQGCKCPACGQFVKEYKRMIYSAMALELIRLYKLDEKNPDQYFHYKLFRTEAGGDATKLRFWKLIEEMPKETEDGNKKNTGMWKITNQGRLFVRGITKVPKYIRTYNKQFNGYDGEFVTIQETLGTDFNYEELMRGNNE